MEEIDVLHNQAMDLAEKAILLKINQKMDESVDAFNAAFSLEMQAAMQIQDKYDFEPSRSIMFRSAASLALNAMLFREAEKMIALGLSGNPPEPIADELRDLYEKINFERHLKVKGVTLSDSDVQLSLSGNATSYGMIKADEFKKLSPDKKEVSTVGLTTSQEGDNNRVAFTRSTEEIKIAPIIHKIDVSELEDTQIYGKLNYADANKCDIRLETDEGESYTIYVPRGVLADIVRPYWEQYVTISGKRQDKKIYFEDIQTEK